MSANLVLHCGAREVSRENLALVPCPPAEGRWRPVPHVQVLDYCEKSLTDSGYVVEKMNLGLSRDDARFFGTLTLKSPVASGVSLAVGLRSSTDKSISLQWACGSRVNTKALSKSGYMLEHPKYPLRRKVRGGDNQQERPKVGKDHLWNPQRLHA